MVPAPVPVAGSPPDSGTAVLVARGIFKCFGPTLANDDVSLGLVPGEIHAILGENGAGKSTLLAVLSGMEQPDAGDIMVDGRVVRFDGPGGALRQGVTTLYQHAILAPSLSIAENVALGGSGVGSSLAEAEARVAPHLHALGVERSPRTLMVDLSHAERQRVEIARALARASRVLLLDEPTALLAPSEVERLLETLRLLRSRGVAIALVTHKLEEALAVADRLTILRAGRIAGVLGPEELGSGDPSVLRQEIVALMFGDAPSPTSPSTPSFEGEVVLSLARVSAHDDRGLVRLHDVSLDLRRGETVGIAGVEGNGQTELVEVVAGQRPVASGGVLLHGRDVANRGVSEAVRAGIAYLTDDRLGEGCVTSASVAENVALKRIGAPPFSNGARLNRLAMVRAAAGVIDRFRVRVRSPLVPIGTLSGGNVQKVLLGRELAFDPSVLVCKEPTQGLDLRTTEEVRATLRRRAASGGATLLVSSDLDELLELSDRIGVLFRGELVGPFPRDEIGRAAIGRMIVSGDSAEVRR